MSDVKYSILSAGELFWSRLLSFNISVRDGKRARVQEFKGIKGCLNTVIIITGNVCYGLISAIVFELHLNNND